MTTSKKYKSAVLASVHETMEDLYEVGAIDKKTMREFDDACLVPVEPLTPEAIKALRLQAQVRWARPGCRKAWVSRPLTRTAMAVSRGAV